MEVLAFWLVSLLEASDAKRVAVGALALAPSTHCQCALIGRLASTYRRVVLFATARLCPNCYCRCRSRR